MLKPLTRVKNIRPHTVRVYHPALSGGYVEVGAGEEHEFRRDVWSKIARRYSRDFLNLDSPSYVPEVEVEAEVTPEAVETVATAKPKRPVGRPRKT